MEKNNKQEYRFQTEISKYHHMEFVFNTVVKKVQEFLQWLSILYQQNHIKFPIKDYFNCLVRLVSPIELMYMKCPSLIIKQFQSMKQRQQSQKMREQQKIQKQIKKESNRNNPKKLRYLKQGMQSTLCEWIKSQINSGNKITRKMIKQKAKQLSNSNQFKSSQGWCDKFLMRNQQIKCMISKMRINSKLVNNKYDSLINNHPLIKNKNKLNFIDHTYQSINQGSQIKCYRNGELQQKKEQNNKLKKCQIQVFNYASDSSISGIEQSQKQQYNQNQQYDYKSLWLTQKKKKKFIQLTSPSFMVQAANKQENGLDIQQQQVKEQFDGSSEGGNVSIFSEKESQQVQC